MKKYNVTGENFKNHLTPRGAESSRIGHGNHWVKSVVTLFFQHIDKKKQSLFVLVGRGSRHRSRHRAGTGKELQYGPEHRMRGFRIIEIPELLDAQEESGDEFRSEEG